MTATQPPASSPAPQPPSNRNSLWQWVVPMVILLGMWGWELSRTDRRAGAEIPYSTFYSMVAADKVNEVAITGQAVQGSFKAEEQVDGRPAKAFQTTLPAREDTELLPLLRAHQVSIQIESEEQPLLVRLLISLLPWALMMALWSWLSQRAQRALGGGGLLSGVASGRTRRFSDEAGVRVRFDDVAGLREAKRDLREVVDFLRDPSRFQKLGAHVPRGVLLVGPPGTGKTLLARAVAGEAGVPFFSITGSEFIELFVGVGASRVRELFETAKKNAPAIVFIDEIDAIGRSRGTGLGGGHDEREQTLNQLLSEMDGFSRNDQTIVLAATNRPDVLDAALLRPGRFDRRVVVERPERAARQAILEVHTRNKPLARDVSLLAIAAATPGFSGADLANLVNEAALHATRRGASEIAGDDFWRAQDKVEMGDPRESPLTQAERRRVAVHEAGHALVAALTPTAEPVKRVTIIPRGMALGSTRQMPGEDRHVVTHSELLSRLRVLAGGYAAEQEVLGELSSGAEHDLKQATDIAYDMIAHYGMSDAVGPVYYEHRAEHPFLGQHLAVEAGLSESTAHLLDVEVQRTLARAVADARALLRERRPLLDRVVDALLSHETVEREELESLLAPALNPALDVDFEATPPTDRIPELNAAA